MKTILVCVCALLIVSDIQSQAIKKIKASELQQYIAACDHPLVVNFWATFCEPCIQELPYFQSKIDAYKNEGVELLLVSLDLPSYYPDRIKGFASSRKYTARIVWLNETNADEFCPLIEKKWTGGIPATLFVNNKTHYRQFYERQLTEPQVDLNLKSLVAQ